MPPPPFVQDVSDRVAEASYADALLVDRDGVITWARGRSVRAARREGRDVVGTPVLRLVSDEDRDRASALVAAARTTGALLIDTLRTSDARALEVALHDLGRLGLLVETWDVTARDARERDLRERSLHDPLTGVANRLLVLDRLEHALLPRRTGPARAGALLVDLDGFAHVNRRWGRAVGDGVLTEVARRIAAVLRPRDTIGRVGDDEFGVVCLELDALDGLRRVADRVLDAVDRPLVVHGAEVSLRASVGGAACLDGTTLPAMLLRAADAARVEAKQQGGGRAVLHAMDALPRA